MPANPISSQATGAGRPSSFTGVPDASGLVRPRLLRRLDDLLHVRLGTVVAPAGAGKTTLMAQWARRAPVDVAWCRADRTDTTTTAVLARLGLAISTLRPVGPPATDLPSLLDKVDAHDSPMVLVIDDLHRIARPEVIDVLHALLMRSRGDLHLLVGSRQSLGFNFARRELSSIAITPDDLRMRTQETASLFRDVYGDPLPPSESDLLTYHTQGWAAGLRLFHQSLAVLPVTERASAVHRLDGRVRFARHYLRREVLAELSEELTTFLRETSVLESLTGSRCDALTGTAHGWQRLLELERLTTHVSSLDAGTSFQVHRLLRRHLITELREERGDAAVDELFRRAGAVLHADGATAEAVRAFALARDWSAVAAVLDSDGPTVVTDRDSGWLTSLPATVVERNHWLQLALAVRSLRDGDLVHALGQSTRASATLTHAEGRAIAAAITHFARVWTSPGVTAGSSWSEQLRDAVRRPRAARPTDRPTRQQTSLLHAVNRVLCGDLVGGREELARCVVGIDGPAAELCARLLLAALGSDGDPTEVEVLADRAQAFGQPWFARLARALASSAEYVDTKGVPPGDPLSQAVDEADLRGDRWAAVLLTGLRSAALLRAGVPDLSGLENLILRSRELDAPALEAWGRAAFALAAAAGDLPDAVREAESAEGFARCCGVPGALAIAYAARALCRDDRREMLALAEAEAEAAGLDVRPWLWLTPPPPQPPPPRSAPGRHRGPSPRLNIRCFGGFSLQVDGEPAPLRRVRPRAREVLRVLALNAGHIVHREHLIDALWRDLDPDAGTHNLHVAVSSLRAALEPGVPRGRNQLIVRDSTGYSLGLPEGSGCDVREFDAALAEADLFRLRGDTQQAMVALQRASGLYTGDVLPEDGAAEWVSGPRDHYRVRAAEASGLLAELHLARDAPRAAAAAALRSIDIDPCRDGSWRLLIAAYGAAGDLAAAERARRSYAEVLTSLGVVADSVSAVRPRRGDDPRTR